MEQIEKITRDGDMQYFEVLKSRKELAERLNDNWWAITDNQWTDEDTAIHWYLKDGTYGCLMNGCPVPRKPAIAQIAQYHESNSATEVIYGKNLSIEQNKLYGDWEVEEI